MKLALSLLVGSIVLAAVCQSYLAVGVPPLLQVETLDDSRTGAQPSGASGLSVPSDNPATAHVREVAAKKLWQDFKLTESDKILDADWRFYALEKDAGGRNRFCYTARLLANLRMDFAAYNQAADCFKTILKQDEFFQPNSVATASDYNNIGVCLAMTATTSGDKQKKDESFAKAMTSLKRAEALYRQLGKKDALYNCYVNEYTLLCDMHRIDSAKIVLAEMRQLNAGRNARLRALMTEQN